jgi:cytochrome c-type biogenesis protein CcsB
MELAERPTQQPQAGATRAGFWTRLSAADWLYALALAAGAGFALTRFGGYMDGYEKAILLLAVPTFVTLGWFWRPARNLLVGAALLSLVSISLYAGELARADRVFLLKYLISSQSSILWMCALFFMATGAYWIGLLARSTFAAAAGSGLTWAAATMALTGMLTRWYESYLIGPDIGHIPISNLYEVFVLFVLITSLLHLYYEQRHGHRSIGAFVLLIVSAAVGFLLWYTFGREAYQIQPLVPALQSWWMKIHVPANFVGYGAFALAAMVGLAYLVVHASGGGMLASRLPPPEVLEELQYRAIAIGFAFFTVATILGALWAAEAWGSYWQWDPKETWALIVWLNYAAWLHMRLMKGLRGPLLAWWSLVGLLVTTFAFLGVNMFLSGLHSYGQL